MCVSKPKIPDPVEPAPAPPTPETSAAESQGSVEFSIPKRKKRETTSRNSLRIPLSRSSGVNLPNA